MVKPYISLIGMSAVLTVGVGSAAGATTLDFEINDTNVPVPDDYGDRAGDTPNVIVDFSYDPATANGFELYNETDATYSGRDWFGVAQLNGEIPFFDITFTPDPGYGVRVESFEFDDYANYEAGHTFDWSVFGGGDSSNVLASADGVVVAPDTTPAENLANPAQPGDNLLIETGQGTYFSGPVTLRIAPVAGAWDDRALDDVVFSQVVIPEPASLAMLGLGGLGLLRRHRRRA